MSSGVATPNAESKTAPTEQSDTEFRELAVQMKIKRQRAIARNGDVDDQYVLAWLLKDGTKEQKKDAFELFRKLADAGVASAKAVPQMIARRRLAAAATGNEDEEFALAWQLKLGTDDQKREALSLFCMLSDAGNIAAKTAVGWCYERGCGVRQDHAKAFEKYRAAARRGHAVAMCNLGLCYALGKGTTKDETMAIECYREAASKGHSDAQYHLASLLLAGTDEQSKEAFALYRRLARAGDVDSKNMLGVCYERGCGVRQNHKKAFDCYLAAAELGDTIAQFNLGCCYDDGKGTDRDELKATYWYRKAADRDHAPSQYNLALCLRDGRGAERDEEMAFKLLCKVAARNYHVAHTALGRAYETGIGCTRAPRKAVECYQAAAKRGDAIAQFNLARCLLAGIGVEKNELNDQLAVEWLQKSAVSDEDSQLMLARCFAQGVGTTRDIGKALRWLAKAEAAGQKAAVVDRMYLQADASSRALFDRWKLFAPSAQLPVTIPTNSLIGPFRLLQTSTFGQAVQCIMDADDGPVEVVVKVPKDERISYGWLNEMLALTAVPEHDNVLMLHGICSEFECSNAKGAKLKPPLSFVTEFCRQGSIVDYFSRKENEGNSAKFLLRWSLDIARGLAHLHKHGCVHRDLAARNVFINMEHHAVIGDLGLARPLDEVKGVFKSEHKSAHYPIEAAPQVLQAEEYSPASDVFSFGLTLFEIATECKFDDAFAFSRSSLSAQAAKIEQLAAKGYPELVSKLPATVPAWMVELMLRCLAFEPAKRPTANAVRAELRSKTMSNRATALDSLPVTHRASGTSRVNRSTVSFALEPRRSLKPEAESAGCPCRSFGAFRCARCNHLLDSSACDCDYCLCQLAQAPFHCPLCHRYIIIS